MKKIYPNEIAKYVGTDNERQNHPTTGLSAGDEWYVVDGSGNITDWYMYDGLIWNH